MIGSGLLIGVPPGGVSRGRVAGEVSVDGAPAQKRVVLLNRKTLEYITSTHSAADGAFSVPIFTMTETKNIVVLGLDDAGVYNAEPADHVTPAEV